jgi:hypothetical protein
MGGPQIAARVMSEDLSRRCAEMVATLARASGVDVSASGAAVRIGRGTITFRARIEARQPGQGRMLVGVAIESAIDGHPGFEVGCVGIGQDEDGAVQTAIQEWSQLVGHALLGAVVTREQSTRFAVGGYLAYAGASGFRGQAPPGWSAADHTRLLAAFQKALPAPIAGVMHAIVMTVVVEPGQMPQGEVRIDREISPSLWLVAQNFDWPASLSGYMFKQFYILVPDR